jgi:glycerol uptake facilitator-like aquaporin
MSFGLTRRLTAEALGTGILVMAVVGSGIMADKLAGGNNAIALLCNTLATGAVLVVIITIFMPVSGAHFNPAVSLVMMLRGVLDRGDTLAYMVVQIAGGCLGAISGPSHVRPRSTATFPYGADWVWPVARRVHRHLRAHRDHSRMRSFQG